MAEIPRIAAPTRKEWRAWLQKNHQKEDAVWLVKHKRHTGKAALTHRESMEEAICFGWIDTVVKSIDEDTFMRCFRKRTKNGKWSTNTIGYAEEMIKQGKMTPVGLQRYKEGKQKPVFESNYPTDIPPDLKRALVKAKALKNFERFSISTRRYFLRRVNDAKQQATKERWMAKTVEAARKNENPFAPQG